MPTITTGLDRVVKEYVDGYRPDLPPLFAGKLSGRLASSRPKGRLSWSDPVNQVAVTGALDDYVVLRDGHAPLDYKTRGTPPREVHRAHQLQLDVYALLLDAHGLSISGCGFLAFVIPGPGELHDGVPFTPEVIELHVSPDRAKKLAIEAAEIIRQETQPPPAPDCGYCRFLREAGGKMAA